MNSYSELLKTCPICGAENFIEEVSVNTEDRSFKNIQCSCCNADIARVEQV